MSDEKKEPFTITMDANSATGATNYSYRETIGPFIDLLEEEYTPPAWLTKLLELKECSKP